eukprot:g5408.t1
MDGQSILVRRGHALLSLLSMVAMHVAFVVWILNQSSRSLRSKRAFFTVGLPASLAIAAEAPVHLLRAKYLAPRRHHCRQFVTMCRPAAMLILWMMLMEVIFANVHSQENGSSHGAVAVNCTRPERGECALYEQTVTECTADPRFFFATPRRLKGLAGENFTLSESSAMTKSLIENVLPTFEGYSISSRCMDRLRKLFFCRMFQTKCSATCEHGGTGLCISTCVDLRSSCYFDRGDLRTAQAALRGIAKGSGAFAFLLKEITKDFTSAAGVPAGAAGILPAAMGQLANAASLVLEDEMDFCSEVSNDRHLLDTCACRAKATHHGEGFVEIGAHCMPIDIRSFDTGPCGEPMNIDLDPALCTSSSSSSFADADAGASAGRESEDHLRQVQDHIAIALVVVLITQGLLTSAWVTVALWAGKKRQQNGRASIVANEMGMRHRLSLMLFTAMAAATCAVVFFGLVMGQTMVEGDCYLSCVERGRGCPIETYCRSVNVADNLEVLRCVPGNDAVLQSPQDGSNGGAQMTVTGMPCWPFRVSVSLWLASSILVTAWLLTITCMGKQFVLPRALKNERRGAHMDRPEHPSSKKQIVHLVKKYNALYNRMFSIRRGTYFWQKHALTNIVEILLQTIFFFSKDLEKTDAKEIMVLSLSILVCSTVIFIVLFARGKVSKATAIVVDISTSAIFLAINLNLQRRIFHPGIEAVFSHLQLVYPVVSICRRLRSLGRIYLFREHDQNIDDREKKCEWGLQNRTMLLGLVILLLCVTCASLALANIFRMERICANIIGPAIWAGSSPKFLLKTVMDARCGFEHVQHVDVHGKELTALLPTVGELLSHDGLTLDLRDNHISSLDRTLVRRFNNASKRTKVMLEGNPCYHSLDLSGMDLRYVPADFLLRFTPAVRRLSLDSNGLQSLPATMGSLEELVHLSVENNSIVPDGLPYTVLQLPELSRLILEGNAVMKNLSLASSNIRCEKSNDCELGLGAVARLWKVSALQSLDLSHNFLSRDGDSISAYLLPLTGLRSLDLGGNLLRRVPKWLHRLPHLESVNLGHNMLQKLLFDCPLPSLNSTAELVEAINGSWYIHSIKLFLGGNPVSTFQWKLTCGSLPQQLLNDLLTPPSESGFKLKSFSIENSWRDGELAVRPSNFTLDVRICSVQTLKTFTILGSSVKLPACLSNLTALTSLSIRHTYIIDQPSCNALDYSQHFPNIFSFALSRSKGCFLFEHWKEPLSPRLRFLYLTGLPLRSAATLCGNRSSWEGLRDLNVLNMGDVHGPRAIEECRGISKLTQLKSLTLAHASIQLFTLPLHSQHLTQLRIDDMYWRNPPPDLAKVVPRLVQLHMLSTRFPAHTNIIGMVAGLRNVSVIEYSCAEGNTTVCDWIQRNKMLAAVSCTMKDRLLKCCSEKCT